MYSSRSASPRRRGRFTALATALIALALPATASACADADLVPNATNLPSVSTSTVCLINVERTNAGLKALAVDAKLTLAAYVHNKAMVDGKFFEHAGQDGSTVTDRIGATGYIVPQLRWFVGENLAWGTGQLSTPRSIVRSWMESPGHRANILQGAFSDIGIAVHMGVPTASTLQTGATYTTDFGHIDRPVAQPPATPQADAAKLAALRKAAGLAPVTSRKTSNSAPAKKASCKKKKKKGKKRKKSTRCKTSSKR